MQYAGVGDKPSADDYDDSNDDVLSENELMLLLRQLIAQADHQCNLFTSSNSPPPPAAAAAAAGECDVLARLKAASDDCDADDDTDRRQFVLNAQQFLASSSLSLTSSHRNMTVIRGQDTVALMFSS